MDADFHVLSEQFAIFGKVFESKKTPGVSYTDTSLCYVCVTVANKPVIIIFLTVCEVFILGCKSIKQK